MSIASVRLGLSLADRWEDLNQRWLDAAPVSRTRVQVASFAVVVLLAYHYSLSSLVRNVDLSTPLAYIGLVPAIALCLAAMRARPTTSEPAIHDRQLDYIVGVPLIASALVINLLLPDKYSDLFWVWRLDLLSLPLFVGGAVALIFGTRVLWRQKLAVLYLFFAWPLPYSLLLLQVLNGFTNITIAALHHIVDVIPVAKVIPSSAGALFQVVHHGKSFPLSVVSACSGVDSVVGFLLIGSAFAALVSGPRLRKMIWLLGGMLLLWAINLGRIVFIFWAGRQWGEHIAISILHPFIGLFTFSGGVVILILVMPRFGLRIGPAAPNGGQRPSRTKGGGRAPVPSIFPAIGLLLVVAMVLGVSDTHLKAYDLVAGSTGEPKLASYTADPAAPVGWTAAYDTQYTWGTPYFGDTSTWLRYQYTYNDRGGDIYANVPITADVINTNNLESFDAYNIQACYNFHGYTMRDVATVSLGGGIKGQALSYSTSGSGDWTIVYWIWPVKGKGSTRYERVVLYVQDTAATKVAAPGVTSGVTSLQGALNPSNTRDARLIAERSFLVQFGRQVVQRQALIPVGSHLAGAPAS